MLKYAAKLPDTWYVGLKVLHHSFLTQKHPSSAYCQKVNQGQLTFDKGTKNTPGRKDNVFKKLFWGNCIFTSK